MPLKKFLQIYIYAVKCPAAMKMKDVDFHGLLWKDTQDTRKG